MLSLEQARHLPFRNVCGNPYPGTKPMESKVERHTHHKAHILKVCHVSIECLIDNEGQPKVITVENGMPETHNCIESLVKAVPALLKSDYLLKLANAANFILKGEQFSVISNPEKYKDTYWHDIEAESEMFELPMSALSRYGIFNIDEIQFPLLDDSAFIFYVTKKIPYKVTISRPFDEHSVAKYELLSYST